MQKWTKEEMNESIKTTGETELQETCDTRKDKKMKHWMQRITGYKKMQKLKLRPEELRESEVLINI